MRPNKGAQILKYAPDCCDTILPTYGKKESTKRYSTPITLDIELCRKTIISYYKCFFKWKQQNNQRKKWDGKTVPLYIF